MDFTLVGKTFDVLGFAPPTKLTLLDAHTLASTHVPPFPPDTPALLMNVDTPELALRLKQVFLTTYPKEHRISVVERGEKKEVKLSEFGGDEFSEDVTLFIPSLPEGTSFESFAEIVAHLRAPY